VLSLRIGYGAMLIAAPQRVTRRWLGTALPPTQVALRALGARETVLHAGALAATLSGASPRPWLAGSIIGDLTDIAATRAARDQLPTGSAAATLAVAGASALVTAVLMATPAPG
jgi:hypothetical protein